MGIGINIAGTGIGLTQTIMNQKSLSIRLLPIKQQVKNQSSLVKV